MADKEIQPFTNIAIAEQGIENQGTTFLSNLRSLSIGDGGSNVFRADRDGMFLGGETFDTAPFKVTMAGAVTASNINIIGGTITGATIQTASTGKRLRMQGSPANQYQFLDGNDKVGHLKIDDDGAGGYYAEIYIDNLGAALQVGSTIGAAEHIYFDAPFIHSDGRAATGSIYFGSLDEYGSGFGAGIVWFGGYDPTWSFSIGDIPVAISSNIVPESPGYYDLGASGKVWANLYVNSITLNGTTRTSWPTSGITSLSELSINTAKSWGGYGITGLGTIIANSNSNYNLGSSSYYWATAYLTKIEFLSLATDPSTRTYGQIWHHYESGGTKQFRGTPWNTDIYSFDMTAI
jgi:hypothetical protein